MPATYEVAKPARFRIDASEREPSFVVPAQRSLAVCAFLLFWLGGWGLGFVQVGKELLTKDLNPFLIVWLGGWTVGGAAAIAALAWMLGGAEVVRTPQRDLELGLRVLGFERRRLYEGARITGLGLAPAPAPGHDSAQASLPGRNGAIRFTYGGTRVVRFGAGLDEAEARLLVEQLRPRLPPAATG